MLPSGNYYLCPRILELTIWFEFVLFVLFQLHEVDVAVCDMLTPTELNCDVACLIYDVTNPRSFEFCARMYLVSLGLILFTLNTVFRILSI